MAHYACALETHKTNGEHHYVSMLLAESKLWKSARSYLLEQHEVSVHFQEKPKDDRMYGWAYYYLTKQDNHIYHSPNHPPLGSIRTSITRKANDAFCKICQQHNANVAGNSQQVLSLSKRERLSRLADFIVDNNIRT